MIKRSIYIALTALLFLCIQSPAYASLISTIIRDATNQLDITWSWDETVPSEDVPVLSNWKGHISLQFFPASAPNDFIGGMGITEYFQNDHPASFAILIAPFKIDQYGILTDFNTSTTNANYHFIYVRDPNPAESVIHLTATAVPIPGAIILFGSGLLGLFITQKRKKYTISTTFRCT